FSSRRRHTRSKRDWSSDVCSSDLESCPACGHRLTKLGDDVDWRCTNAECPPQIRQRIAHFASRDAMDIEGLGEKIVDQLVTEGHIQNYADLYKIDKEQLLPLDHMAEKSAQKLIDSIDQSREMRLDRVIYALGIRFVGKTVARDLAAAFETIHNLMEANEEQIAAIDAVGPTIAQSVSSFFNDPAN